MSVRVNIQGGMIKLPYPLGMWPRAAPVGKFQETVPAALEGSIPQGEWEVFANQANSSFAEIAKMQKCFQFLFLFFAYYTVLCGGRLPWILMKVALLAILVFALTTVIQRKYQESMVSLRRVCQKGTTSSGVMFVLEEEIKEEIKNVGCTTFNYKRCLLYVEVSAPGLPVSAQVVDVNEAGPNRGNQLTAGLVVNAQVVEVNEAGPNRGNQLTAGLVVNAVVV